MKATSYISAIALVLGSALALSSCQESGRESRNSDSADEGKAQAALSVSEVGSSPEFPDAAIRLESAVVTEKGKDSVTVKFAFGISNYSLRTQTADKDAKRCNNSADGQHIHFILNNKPYKALYEPVNEERLAVGSEHYLLAFLSRSYHESLKNKEAALVYHFRIDGDGTLVRLDDPTTPMVFYSRPKGDYLGADTENVLFDYYVWNAGLSGSEYSVKAEVKPEQGKDTSFILTEWKSLFLSGLPMGKAEISVSLQDASGNPVSGPHTSASGKFQLAAGEPMK